MSAACSQHPNTVKMFEHWYHVKLLGAYLKTQSGLLKKKAFLKIPHHRECSKNYPVARLCMFLETSMPDLGLLDQITMLLL